MARANTKIGDMFEAEIDANNKKYLQYIISDQTQLNSDVIRVFKKIYSIGDSPDLRDVTKGEVEFYAHCVTKWGVKLGYWKTVGNIADVGETDHVLFRDTSDYGNPSIKVSQNWWVWKINQQQVEVGSLEGEYQKAEIGLVINPESIVYRMRTGQYDFKHYPAYK